MTLLRLDSLSVRRGERRVIDGVSLSVSEGECVGLLGRNGAGKTTLMRAALGLLPASGTATLAALPARERAKAAAWLPQDRRIAWPVSVERLVALGRIPHLPTGARLAEADRAAVDAAIAQMGLEGDRHRAATNLSGGEQARVLIARVLAQETPLVMADEPIAGLDPAYQIATMRHFRAMAEAGKAVVTSLHDLGLAARFCTRLVLLEEGRVTADGRPEDVLSPANIARAFGIRAHLSHGPDGVIFQPLELV